MIRKVENANDGQSSDFHSMDAYRLVELASGVRTIRSSKVGETFHPVIGPEAEALALYSGQLKLTPRAGPELDPITIWDVGLGGAANPIVVLKSLGGVHPSVRVLSFDHTLEPLLFAVQNSSELGYLKGWEGWLRELAETGEVHFEWGCTKIQWQFLEGDFPGLLNGSSASSWPVPDAILFDAFSPARNPAMWTLPLFSGLFSRLSPDRPCTMPTYSRSTMLRTTLLLAGFCVGKGRATGEKEETTVASNDPASIEHPLDGDWLRRCRNSSSAEPMIDPVYRQLPLSESNWEKLLLHPQFRSTGKTVNL